MADKKDKAPKSKANPKMDKFVYGKDDTFEKVKQSSPKKKTDAPKKARKPLSASKRTKLANLLSQIETTLGFVEAMDPCGLGDIFEATKALQDQTQRFHWEVVGPLFPQLHELFGEQYDELNAQVDALAERLRQKGIPVPSFQSQAVTGVEDAVEMVAALADLHRDLEKLCNSSVKAADQAGDAATVDLLSKQAAFHAKQAWFLESTSWQGLNTRLASAKKSWGKTSAVVPELKREVKKWHDALRAQGKLQVALNRALFNKEDADSARKDLEAAKKHTRAMFDEYVKAAEKVPGVNIIQVIDPTSMKNLPR